MDPEETNKILLHTVPNSWERQAYIQGWEFKRQYSKDTCNIFEHTEIAEAIYKGGAPYKNNQRAEADRVSYGRKKKVGASASPSNSKQGRTGNCKRSNASHPSDEPTGANKTCLMHGPGHYSK